MSSVDVRLDSLASPGAGPLLVDGAGGDLLGRVLALAPLLEPFLDVLVLTLSLLAPRSAVASWSSLSCRLFRTYPVFRTAKRGQRDKGDRPRSKK